MQDINVSGNQAALAGYVIRPSRRSTAARFFRSLASDRLALVAFVFFAFVLIISGLAPVLFPKHDIGDLGSRLLNPVWAGGTWAHPFGTDEQGKDLLAQMVWGARITIRVGLIVTFVAGLLGIALGLIAGYTVAIEIVFAWPGIGSLVVDAIKAGDFPLVQTLAIVIAVMISLLNLAVDLSYPLFDPRVKYGS